VTADHDGPVIDRDGHVDIVVWAVPGAKRSGIAGLHGDAVRIRVSQPPEKGKANEALKALLDEQLGAPVWLVAGSTGRRKRYRVAGLSAAVVRRRLGV
jgi:uncharacterized protein (TIGR00251 family)